MVFWDVYRSACTSGCVVMYHTLCNIELCVIHYNILVSLHSGHQKLERSYL